MNRRSFLRAGAGAGVVRVAGCLGGEEVTADSTRTVDVADAESLRVRNHLGDVTVRGTQREDVFVRIQKRSRRGRDALDAVRLEVSRQDGTLHLRGTLDANDPIFDGPQVSMDLDVEVPASDGGLPVEHVETDLGDVLVRGVGGTPEVVSGLGDVEVAAVSAFSRAYSDLGDVDVEVRSVPAGGCSAETDLGDVALWLSSSLNCQLEATVDLGDVSNHGVAFSQVSTSSSHLSGRLGDGGPTLTASSDLGDVDLYPLSE